MPEQKEKKQEGLIKQIKNFYFTRGWESLFKTTYLFIFVYFSIFYLDNFIISLKFIIQTFKVSTTLLSLSHVIWGAIFVVALATPFLISLSMILSLPSIWEEEKWKKDQKLLITIIIFILAITLIIITDDLINTVVQKEVLDIFLIGTEIQV